MRLKTLLIRLYRLVSEVLTVYLLQKLLLHLWLITNMHNKDATVFVALSTCIISMPTFGEIDTPTGILVLAPNCDKNSSNMFYNSITFFYYTIEI